MANKVKNLGLILAIIFASSVISGSLVFFGMQVGGKGGGKVDVADIEKAFENFAKNEQKKQLEAQQQGGEEDDKQRQEIAKNVKKISKSEDHIRGNINADVTLISYSDFECPFCKRFHATSKQIMAAYDGKINWVYRHFPLSFHEPMASKEAAASECANELGGNDKFWEYADLIYEKTTSNGNGLDEEKLVAMAVEIGLNKNAFTTCLSSNKYDEKIKQDIADGDKAGVTGTPGNFVVNNKTGEIYAMDGALPFTDPNRVDFKEVIDKMLGL